jgi:hypothetical protein
MAHEPAAACMLARPPIPANGSPGSRLDDSGCPVCRGCATVFVDPGDVLAAAHPRGTLARMLLSADLLVSGRAAAGTPPTGRLGHASRSHAAVEAVVTALVLAASGHRANAAIADPEERSTARRVRVCGESRVSCPCCPETRVHPAVGPRLRRRGSARVLEVDWRRKIDP